MQPSSLLLFAAHAISVFAAGADRPATADEIWTVLGELNREAQFSPIIARSNFGARACTYGGWNECVKAEGWSCVMDCASEAQRSYGCISKCSERPLEVCPKLGC
ncbi:unnamed protein product [Colletotrichum noveboracense]|uniref:Uncharacterized protein n=1 Tax=Colletotrichum noveboracense TaxID=2664923 RepID=A0A9W4S319_9PEZI|nr:hypothetical protein K456DRAFT_42344 [Colletotrichum gloeosporioides 23]CAI0651559.1 unnamed protein product [Colletotrichum noveboracense]